jgi:hypothetical protein
MLADGALGAPSLRSVSSEAEPWLPFGWCSGPGRQWCRPVVSTRGWTFTVSGSAIRWTRGARGSFTSSIWHDADADPPVVAALAPRYREQHAELAKTAWSSVSGRSASAYRG